MGITNDNVIMDAKEMLDSSIDAKTGLDDLEKEIEETSKTSKELEEELSNEIGELETMNKPVYTIEDGLLIVEALNLKIENVIRIKNLCTYDRDKEGVKIAKNDLAWLRKQRRMVIDGIDIQSML